MSSARRRRYGSQGRAFTSPALISSTVAWTPHPETSPAARPSAALPPRIPPDPIKRAAARRASEYRTVGISGDQATNCLVSKYLNASRERIDNGEESIEQLINRYRPKSIGIEDVCLSRRNSIQRTPTPSSPLPPTPDNSQIPLTEARLSGSDVRIRWQLATAEKTGGFSVSANSAPLSNSKAVTSQQISSGTIKSFLEREGSGRMPIGGSSSRSGRLARISQSNIRPFGSGAYNSSVNGPGSQPLAGPEPPGSPHKKEFKHRFEIVKKLGSGTYGKVSLAFDHKFEREVAVKLIKKSAIENKADLIRIRREIRIMSALNHPNIIQIFEVFENKDKIILVMEYASGGELYDYVSKFGSLPESEARRIFRQITSAVLYCHKHKVAHRDLKLENILLDQDNNAKIADFGLSNYFSDKNLLTTFCGSPLYASPEIINGTPYRGPEVDCWSLGILLYTLVYGSMPFDGRDFNRMVRQIRRGAYFEPDTPSTASMLIRNMLRVNPDRRADIFEIASHWWLNLEENMPVIQELPENQITDHTPLTERAETILVQDLADETDVFMEFGHLSSETRKKIEEFRRRRTAAEEYLDNSPIKPPKTRRTDGQETEEMRSDEKSLRGAEVKKEKDTNDPLERLKQIETRLGKPQPRTGLSNVPKTAPPNKEVPGPYRAPEVKETPKVEPKKVEQPEDPRTARSSQRAPSFVPVHEPSPPPPTVRRNSNVMASVNTYRIETDSLNMLMNQVLEQMEKGPVSLNLVARIQAHPLYDTRPMVKELLESIIGAQPRDVQRQTSRLMMQQSQGQVGKPDTARRDSKNERQVMGERPWHSVEVGFDPDEEVEAESMKTSSISTATEVTVQDTSFEDSDDQKEATPRLPSESRQTQTEVHEPEESDLDEEYSDSEMEELADVVDMANESGNSSKVKEKELLEAPPPPDPGTSPSPQFLDAFDRGLIKRQSKGKYQHSRVDQYGRGVSQCESPTMTRKLLGGPQPTKEQSPFLFDKAKKIIMSYPTRPDPSELDDLFVKKKKDWLKSVESAIQDGKVTPTPSCVGSVPPRTPPPIESEEEEEEESEEEEEDEESEEEDIEIVRRPRTIIGAVRRDGDRIETTVSTIGSHRKTAYMQSAPASIHASMSPEPVKPSTNAKYLVTVAELKAKPPPVTTTPSIDPKPYSRITLGGGNVDNTKTEIEKKIAERESQLKDELAEHARPLHYMNPMFLPGRGYSSRIGEKKKEEKKEEGKESWESAAAYIRRKNRERRFRNRTIGDPEEVIRATMGLSDTKTNGTDHAMGRLSPVDPFYSHHSGTSNLLSYVRPRFHEDSYRRRDLDDRPLSPVSRINTAAVVREERGKSFSLHDSSPDRPDYRSGAYAVGDTRSYYTNASPGYTRKFDYEIGGVAPTSSLNSWATEPRKFEVYKTRAERDREMNTLHTTPTAPSAYRPSTYTSSTSDRPLTYGYRSTDPTYKSTGSDSYGYRRTLDLDRSVTPGLDHVLLNPTGPSIETSAARGAARRVQSALTESDRRNYARSRSMDRKQSRGEHDYGAPIRSRLMTPDNAPDYTYVNYHDSSNGRSSQSRDEKGQPRSILKNKQTAETEPRADVSGNGRGLDGGIGQGSRIGSVIDRLRRHLSLEKGSPPLGTRDPTAVGAAGRPGQSVGDSQKDYPDLSGTDDTPKRKRSLLGFNRRKTSEVRLGSDGKMITNGYDDYKRPSSPIDKIKSLFRRDSATRDTSNINNNDFYTSRYTSAADKSYPSTNVAREPYVPQYRKYPGSSPRDTDRSLNRYSYTSGLTDQRRHWFDDHNLY